MKKITQTEIAKTLGCKPPTVSRYFSNLRDISLKDAEIVSKKHNLPITIFIDGNLQKRYFGKSFLSEESIATKENNK